MDLPIRQARPDDAAGCLAYMEALALEPDIDIPLAPGEFKYTIEQEAKILQDYADADNSLFLVAESQGQIVGILTCHGGTRQAVRHAATLGVTVRKGYRGQGIGNALLEYTIGWAREGGVIKRIELDVYVRNQGAIRLYLKHGFEIEGRHRRAICQDDEYLDDYVMSLLL